MVSASTAFAGGKKAGLLIGRQEVRKQVLDYLQEKYMDPTLVRGSERGEAILEIVRELSPLMKVQ